MSGSDYCFYEIISKGRDGEKTRLIQDDDFEKQLEYGMNEYGARHKGQQFPAMVAAKHFVVPTERVLEVNKKCGYELLEHLNDYYRSIE